MGIAGLTWCQSQGALKMKKRIAGSAVRENVATLSGLALVLRKRPPRKKSALPA